MKQKDTAKLRSTLVPYAEQITASLIPSGHLDFSPESIHLVEEVLGMLHTEYISTGSDEGLDGVALEFAAYIVEVIDRNFGPVDWQRDDPRFGKDAFPLNWRTSTLFPYAWCQKRLFDGPADNVWSKFSVLVLEKVNPQKRQSGFFEKLFHKHS
jgi:hypothetical protein